MIKTPATLVRLPGIAGFPQNVALMLGSEDNPAPPGIGLPDEIRVYPPFGPFTGGESYVFDSNVATAKQKVSQGYIGERYDPDAGLQFLNARYYDPKLARLGKTLPRRVF